jgi:L-aspartate oxidase
MPDYNEMAELAPRDIVSRAIVSEMKKDRTHHVFLDLTGRGKEFVENRFPTITRTLLEYGVHPGESPVPVAPAAHYICGGVWTDIDGRSTIQGLYAGGEVACTGVHGANRLASNSLLESVVFAYRAAVNADRRIRYLSSDWWDKLKPIMNEIPRELTADIQDSNDLKLLRKELQEINWRYCGIIRTDEGLRNGMKEIHALQTRFNQLGGFDSSHIKALELANLITLSKIVFEAALARRVNAGTHFNSDCQAQSEGS